MRVTFNITGVKHNITQIKIIFSNTTQDTPYKLVVVPSAHDFKLHCCSHYGDTQSPQAVTKTEILQYMKNRNREKK